MVLILRAKLIVGGAHPRAHKVSVLLDGRTVAAEIRGRVVHRWVVPVHVEEVERCGNQEDQLTQINKTSLCG